MKRGCVTLSTETVAKLLHLRAGLRVTSVKFSPMTDTATFFVAGEDLEYLTGKGEHAVRYPLPTLMDLD
ncbi:MAG: hypothetical protein LAP40_16900 [Acidobacteriia bacterium]|nr:hypothetical protein [Terriglobia bacterium]